MMQTIVMNDAFGADYECKQLFELPASLSVPHYYYPDASTQGGQDGLVISVSPAQGAPWIGTFAFGRLSASKEVCGIYATPDPEMLCVVAKGQGYFVSVRKPEVWEQVQAKPIVDVRPVHAMGIIIFAEFTRLVCYGRDGLVWKTDSIGWDGFKVTDIENSVLRGEFWDAPSESRERFEVDLATGRFEKKY